MMIMMIAACSFCQLNLPKIYTNMFCFEIFYLISSQTSRHVTSTGLLIKHHCWQRKLYRLYKLLLSLCPQYLSEANDILSWLTEKHHLLSGTDFGRDSAASDSLLTKHKVCVLMLKVIFSHKIKSNININYYFFLVDLLFNDLFIFHLLSLDPYDLIYYNSCIIIL